MRDRPASVTTKPVTPNPVMRLRRPGHKTVVLEFPKHRADPFKVLQRAINYLQDL